MIKQLFKARVGSGEKFLDPAERVGKLRTDPTGSATLPGQPEDDLGVREAVELGERFDEEGGGAALGGQQIPIHNNGPDDVSLEWA